MEVKETSYRSLDENRILDDAEYYKYIFKKTEKIVCAVFYILRSDKSIGQDDLVIKDVETSAEALLACALLSLRSTSSTVATSATSIKYALIELESKLRVISSAHLLSVELLEVFLHEIDSVQRSLRKYTESTDVNPLERDVLDRVSSTHERKVARIKMASPYTRVVSRENLPIVVSRREKVLNVIKDKGNATIKDVMEVITDCSEKTIQRELMTLIKDNIILREGERRWSKYRLV